MLRESAAYGFCKCFRSALRNVFYVNFRLCLFFSRDYKQKKSVLHKMEARTNFGPGTGKIYCE